MEDLTLKIPGKLYLAGEYAVMTPKQPALLLTLDAFLTIKSRPSERSVGTLKTNQSSTLFHWTFDENQQLMIQEDGYESFNLLWKSIDLISRLVEKPTVFDIEISSKLDDPSGKKYGLGSSGAVTVAMVKSLLLQYGLFSDLSTSEFDVIVFKLAVLVQHDLGMDGSYGDIAASTLTGLTYYQNFERECLDHQTLETKEEILEVLNAQWPHLILRRIPQDEMKWYLSVAWTGYPSDTTSLLDQAEGLSDLEIEEAKKDLEERSRPIIKTLKQNLIDHHFLFFKNTLHANANILENFTGTLRKTYLTPQLTLAVDIARLLGSASKISGAGGGDCVISISETKEQADRVEAAWAEKGLVVLPFHFWSEDKD